MAPPRLQVIGLIALMMCVVGLSATQAPAAPESRAAPPELVSELRPVVDHARQRFEARDAAGDVRQQLLAMFSLYEVLRARVRIDNVQVADGVVWVYTSGEVTGRLPLAGWMTVLTWQNEPEVARREEAGWRLFGFQN
jgi:hypothetical protein